MQVTPQQQDEDVEFALRGDNLAALDDLLQILVVLRRDNTLELHEHLLSEFGRYQ